MCSLKCPCLNGCNWRKIVTYSRCLNTIFIHMHLKLYFSPCCITPTLYYLYVPYVSITEVWWRTGEPGACPTPTCPLSPGQGTWLSSLASTRTSAPSLRVGVHALYRECVYVDKMEHGLASWVCKRTFKMFIMFYTIIRMVVCVPVCMHVWRLD